MFTNIEKALQRRKEQKISYLEENEIVKEVKLLESADATEDMRIAKGLGKCHTIIKAQEQLGRKLEIEKLDITFNGGVFTIDEIRRLAIRYKLRFLQSKYYQADIPVEVIQNIKSFSKETNTAITEAALEYNFYILAPAENFLLEDKISLRKRDLDPAMFYKISDTHWRLIKKWGSDFTILRRIKGALWADWRSRFTTLWLMWTLIIGVCYMTIAYMTGLSYGFVGLEPIPALIIAGLNLPEDAYDNDNSRSSGQREASNRWYSKMSWNLPCKLKRKQ